MAKDSGTKHQCQSACKRSVWLVRSSKASFKLACTETQKRVTQCMLQGTSDRCFRANRVFMIRLIQSVKVKLSNLHSGKQTVCVCLGFFGARFVRISLLSSSQRDMKPKVLVHMLKNMKRLCVFVNRQMTTYN